MCFFIRNCVTEWHIFLLWNPSYCHKRSRRKRKRGTRWPEEEALAMYLHFYGNRLGQTWPWSSVVRGTWGQVPSSWSEAAVAAVCREWDGTRKQTSKASKLSIDRNKELVGFSLHVCSWVLWQSLPMCTCKWAPHPLKGLCSGREWEDR